MGDSAFALSGPGAVPLVSWFIARILFQIDGLNDVARKEKLHRPIHQDANFAFQSRQFCKIDSSPHGPCQQAGKAHGLGASKGNGQFGASSLVADDAEGAKRIEMEWPQRPSFERGANVLCENWSFAERKLRGRRAGLAGHTIHHCRAIAQSPDAGMILDRESGLDNHGPTLVSFNRERPEERIRRSAGCPDERFCREFAVIQLDHTGLEVCQTGVEAEDDAARGHFLLRVPPQGFTQLWKNAIS